MHLVGWGPRASGVRRRSADDMRSDDRGARRRRRETVFVQGAIIALAVAAGASESVFAQDAPEEDRAAATQETPPSVNTLLSQTPDMGLHPLTSLGSFLLVSSLGASAIYNGNLHADNSVERAGMVYSVSPELRAISQWARHSLELFVGGDGRFYQEYASENQTNFHAGARGSLDIYHDLHLLMQARYDSRHEQRGEGESFVNFRTPVQTESLDASASLNKQFNRLWLQFGGTVRTSSYHDAVLLTDRGAVPLDQGYRSGDMYEVSGRAGYEFSDRMSLFVEKAYNWRDYGDQSFDSEGARLLGGLRYEFSSLVRAELAAGWMQQAFKSAERTNIDTFSYRAQLLWDPTPFVSVALLSNREIGDPSALPGLSSHVIGGRGALHDPSSRVNTEAGLRVTYAFRPDLQIMGGAGYDWIDYIDRNQMDNRVRLTGGAQYDFSQHLSFSLRYMHDAYLSSSEAPVIDYGRDAITAGVTARY